MVGVLNGKAKKVSVVAVVCLLCGVFGGLVVEQSLASDFRLGYTGIGASSATEGLAFTLYNNVSLTVPEGYYAELNAFYAYLGNTSASQVAHGAVFDQYGSIVGQTGAISVSGTKWYNVSLSGSLVSGVYYIGVGLGASVTRYYVGGVGSYGMFYTDGYGFDTTVVPVYNAMNAVSMYVTYEMVAFDAVDVVSSEWLGVGVSFGLVAVSLFLALKSRSWAVNFLFGLSLVGFLGWTFANSAVELFGGWLDFMVLVGAVLVLVKGAVLVRASGV